MKRMIVLVFLGGCVAGGGEARSRSTLAGVPPAAAEALAQEAGGAALGGVEHEHDHGVDTYEAGWTAGGVAHEAKVTADGALVEREERIGPEQLPAAVRDELARRFPGGGKVALVRKTWVLYEAEGVTADGQRAEVLLAPTGREVDEGEEGEGDEDDEEADD